MYLFHTFTIMYIIYADAFCFYLLCPSLFHLTFGYAESLSSWACEASLLETLETTARSETSNMRCISVHARSQSVWHKCGGISACSCHRDRDVVTARFKSLTLRSWSPKWQMAQTSVDKGSKNPPAVPGWVAKPWLKGMELRGTGNPGDSTQRNTMDEDAHLWL